MQKKLYKVMTILVSCTVLFFLSWIFYLSAFH